MNAPDFSRLLHQRLEKIKGTLSSKRMEYAPDEDVLHNFKKGATLNGTTPEQTLRGYLTKHLVSVFDMIENIAAGNVGPDEKLIDDKVGDCINYFILLEGLLVERDQRMRNEAQKQEAAGSALRLPAEILTVSDPLRSPYVNPERDHK